MHLWCRFWVGSAFHLKKSYMQWGLTLHDGRRNTRLCKDKSSWPGVQQNRKITAIICTRNLNWIFKMTDSESVRNKMRTPSQTHARREEANAFYDLVLIPFNPFIPSTRHIRSKLQIILFGQGVRMATLVPTRAMCIRNDNGEELILNAARTSRLVKYCERENNSVFPGTSLWRSLTGSA